MDWIGLSESLWAVFFLYWAATARRRPARAKREALISRVVNCLRLVVAFLLLYSPLFAKGPLLHRFVPDAPWLPAVGFLLQLVALGLAMAMRRVRHPFHTGMLGGFVGAAIIIGQSRGLAAVGLILLAYLRKINQDGLREET